jgi:6-phosphogluconolactonase (cycloisomerase 2 family)
MRFTSALLCAARGAALALIPLAATTSSSSSSSSQVGGGGGGQGSSAAPSASPSTYSVLVGFVSNSPVELLQLDRTSGAIQRVGTADCGPSPAWMDFRMAPPNFAHSIPDRVYIANHDDSDGSGVTVMDIVRNATDSSVAGLSFNSAVSMAEAANPVSLALLHDVLYTVSYSEGTLSSFAVQQNGSLLPAATRVGVCPGNNAHQILLAPNTKPTPGGGQVFTAFIPCLGSDRILNSIAGAGCGPGVGQVCAANVGVSRPGSGPRHVALHPSLPTTAYVMNEKDNSISVWKYDPSQPQMSEPTYVSALPPGTNTSGTFWAGAEIAFSNDARFLYASNRALSPSAGNSSIVRFAVDPTTGALSSPLWFDGSGQVQFPRHFSLTPDNRFALIANQRGNSVTVASIDPTTGALTFVQTLPTLGASPAYVQVVPDRVPSPGVASGSRPAMGDGGGALALAAATTAVAATLARGRGL